MLLRIWSRIWYYQHLQHVVIINPKFPSLMIGTWEGGEAAAGIKILQPVDGHEAPEATQLCMLSVYGQAAGRATASGTREDKILGLFRLTAILKGRWVHLRPNSHSVILFSVFSIVAGDVCLSCISPPISLAVSRDPLQDNSGKVMVVAVVVLVVSG